MLRFLPGLDSDAHVNIAVLLFRYREDFFPERTALSSANNLLQVSNCILRFAWVLYIPTGGPNFIVRTFITSMLEVLRRWQWNFCASLFFLQPNWAHVSNTFRYAAYSTSRERTPW